MAKIIVVKTLKEMAKANGKQCGKDFVELLDRKIYNQIERMITSIHQKRLTEHDII